MTSETEAPDFNLDHLEKQGIIDALHFCEGNRTIAAKALGISLRTLQRMIHKHDLPVLLPSSSHRAAPHLT